MIGLVSWFIGLQLRVAPGIVGLLLALYGFEIPLNFVRLCSYMRAELLFLSPTIFFADFRTDHSTPTCNLKSDFATLVRFCEIF